MESHCDRCNQQPVLSSLLVLMWCFFRVAMIMVCHYAKGGRGVHPVLSLGSHSSVCVCVHEHVRGCAELDICEVPSVMGQESWLD